MVSPKARRQRSRAARLRPIGGRTAELSEYRLRFEADNARVCFTPTVGEWDCAHVTAKRR